MDYRDERDALRGRVENLEQDLDEARRAQQGDDKTARIAQLEARLNATQEQLGEVQRELSEVKGTTEKTVGSRGGAERSPAISPGEALMGSAVIAGIGMLVVGLSILTAVIFNGSWRGPVAARFAELVAAGALLTAAVRGAAWLQTRSAGTPTRTFPLRWKILRTLSLSTLVSSACALIVVTHCDDTHTAALLVALAASWGGVVGLGLFAGLAPPARTEGDRPPSQ